MFKLFDLGRIEDIAKMARDHLMELLGWRENTEGLELLGVIFGPNVFGNIS